MTHEQFNTSDILAELRPSKLRFGVTLVAIAAMGAVLAAMGLTNADVGLGLRTLAILGGIGLVFLAARVTAQGRSAVVLTRDGLFEITGRPICTVQDIANVDRGFTAIRPSTGFSVQLKTRHSAAWSPGLWWRFGKMVGVGGITPPTAGRFMADALATALKERSEGSSDE